METYEEALGEAVQLLISHGEQRGPVTDHFYARLRRERDLQIVLLGEELPRSEEEASRVIHDRGVNAVHSLINRAMKRLQATHRSPGQ
jgi:hypothetical protein